MSAIADFLHRLTWQDVATAAGVLFGIISTIAYLDQRRSAKGQQAIAEFARRHVAKDIAEQAIQELAAQRQAMEDEVTQKIPAMAREAVLKEQAELHARAIAEHYQSWNKIVSELTAKSAAGAIDPALRKVILDRILPRYETERALERLRNRITGLSVALALTSTLFPEPVSTLIALAIAFPLASSLFKFLRLQSTPSAFAQFVRTAATVAYAGAILSSAFFGVLLFTVSPNSITQAGRALRVGLLVMVLLGVIGYIPFRRWIQRRTPPEQDRIN